jgi:quercetin dioxygenase-like cupin family protein
MEREEYPMTPNAQSHPIVDPTDMEWGEHPRVAGISMKKLLTSDENPLASVNLVKVPEGGVVGHHMHADQVETVYVLKGQCVLTIGEDDMPFGAGQIVALPAGVEHELRNVGSVPVELITFFTPPID